MYEANVKGWLANKGGKDFVSKNKYFGPMKAAGVSFYDTAASHSILVKPLLSKVYDFSEDDDDWDIEFAKIKAGVSG